MNMVDNKEKQMNATKTITEFKCGGSNYHLDLYYNVDSNKATLKDTEVRFKISVFFVEHRANASLLLQMLCFPSPGVWNDVNKFMVSPDTLKFRGSFSKEFGFDKFYATNPPVERESDESYTDRYNEYLKSNIEKYFEKEIKQMEVFIENFMK
jgi:hypothetical protein